MTITPVAVRGPHLSSTYDGYVSVYRVHWRGGLLITPVPDSVLAELSDYATVVVSFTETLPADVDLDGSSWPAEVAQVQGYGLGNFNFGGSVPDVPQGDYTIIVNTDPAVGDGDPAHQTVENFPLVLRDGFTDGEHPIADVKPAGLTYAAQGHSGGYQSVAYLVTDAATAGTARSGVRVYGHAVVDGYDDAVEVADGGVDGDPPYNVGDYVSFNAGGMDVAGMLSNWGFNPYSLAHQPDAGLPTVSELLLAALSAPYSDADVPLPGFPNYTYHRSWGPADSYPYAVVQVDWAGSPDYANMAVFDSAAFDVYLALPDRDAQVMVMPNWLHPSSDTFFTDGYNVPNGYTNDPLPAALDGTAVINGLWVIDSGPVMTDGSGYDAWTTDPSVPPPTDYPWPGPFSLIGAATEPTAWALIPGSDTRALTPEDTGWFALLDEGPCVIIGDIAYVVSGFLYNSFDVVDVEAWVATQPGLTMVGDKSQQEFDYVAGDVWFVIFPSGESTAWSATGPGHFDAATNWPSGVSSGDNSAILDYRNRGYAWRLQNQPNEYAWTYLERFNTVTGQWLPRILMPGSPAYAAEGGFAVEHDGKIYFGGGDGQYADSGAFFMFDPTTEEFTALPNAPMSGDYNPYGKVGNTLYVFLGSTMWAYDFTASTWSSRELTGGQPSGDWILGHEYNGKLIFADRDVFVVDVDAATITLTPVFQTWNGLPIVWIDGDVLHMAGWDYAATDTLPGGSGAPKQFAFNLVTQEITEEDPPGVAGSYASYAVKNGVPYVIAGGRSGGKQNIPPSGLLTGAYSFGSGAPSGGGGASGVSAIGGTLSVIGGALSVVGGS